MPVWVAIEIFSFGMLSKLYGNIRPQLQRDFVRSYLHKPKEYTPCLPSWLKSMVEVRNICAHYGRIYNRTLTSMPAMLPQYKHSVIPKNRIFSVLLFMILMLDDYSKSTSLILNIKNLIEEYDAVDMNLIGFPLNWESLLNNAR